MKRTVNRPVSRMRRLRSSRKNAPISGLNGQKSEIPRSWSRNEPPRSAVRRMCWASRSRMQRSRVRRSGQGDRVAGGASGAARGWAGGGCKASKKARITQRIRRKVKPRSPRRSEVMALRAKAESGLARNAMLFFSVDSVANLSPCSLCYSGLLDRLIAIAARCAPVAASARAHRGLTVDRPRCRIGVRQRVPRGLKFFTSG